MRRRPADEMLTDLKIVDSVPAVQRDDRITLGGRAAQLKAESIILDDRLSLSEVLKSNFANALIKSPSFAPEKRAKSLFRHYSALIDSCDAANLPKLTVEASLNYAGTTRAYQSYCRTVHNDDMQMASQQVDLAKALLEKAKGDCRLGFQNADALLKAVNESLRLLSREWYEEVTAEEVAAIKKAMVTAGSAGIITHSGHWYNCANGHPVSCVLYVIQAPRCCIVL